MPAGFRLRETIGKGPILVPGLTSEGGSEAIFISTVLEPVLSSDEGGPFENKLARTLEQSAEPTLLDSRYFW